MTAEELLERLGELDEAGMATLAMAITKMAHDATRADVSVLLVNWVDETRYGEPTLVTAHYDESRFTKHDVLGIIEGVAKEIRAHLGLKD